MIDPEIIFKLAQDEFEKFYDGHFTRESEIALKAVRNFRGIFDSYLATAEKMELKKEEV